MKYFSIILTLIIALAAASYGQQSKSDTRKDEAADLLRIENEIGQANIHRDKAFFEKIESDDFIFTDSSGGVTTKNEDLASLDKPAGETKLVCGRRACKVLREDRGCHRSGHEHLQKQGQRGDN